MSKLPPPDLLMQISNSSSVTDFTSSFPHVSFEVQKYLGKAGYRIEEFDSILDFGCGVGRFSYAMRPLLKPSQRLYGCDLDIRCAKWSSENAGYTEVLHNGLQPPLSWANDSFDFIYALSVFTHLTFEHQLRWAWEMIRLLRPEGVLMFTTHGLGHLGPALVNGSIWKHRDYFLIDHEALFCALSEAGGGRIEGQREVASFHNKESIVLQFDPLKMRLHEHVSSMAGGQSMNILVKAANGSAGTMAPAETIESEDTLLRVRSCSFSDSTNLQLRGFLSLPAARYDLQSLCVVAEYESKGGLKQRQTTTLATPVCLGNHHSLTVRFAIDDAAPDSSIALSLIDRDNQLVACNWLSLHWFR